MSAVIYGAGNIGRGFIGQIFGQSGCELIFIDTADALVRSINQEGRYPIRIIDNEHSEDIWITGIRAVNGKDEEAVSDAIADADIMATAAGVRVLPLIAPVIAGGLKKRFARNNTPLNIIICENLIDADKALARYIKEYLNDDEQKLMDKLVGFVEASVGRMVPLQTEQMREGNPMRICAEAYGFLPVNKAAFKGRIPDMKGLLPFDNFDFYIERKLFIHNMGHCICACLGLIHGYSFIYEAVSHPGILLIAQNAMQESALALSAQNQMPLDALVRHIRDLLNRFSNRALQDTCARVGADTIRKLGSGDRFIGALRCCVKNKVSPSFIRIGTAAALYCRLAESGAAFDSETARSELQKLSGLEGDEADRILLFYSLIAECAYTALFDSTIERLIKLAMNESRENGVI